MWSHVCVLELNLLGYTVIKTIYRVSKRAATFFETSVKREQNSKLSDILRFIRKPSTPKYRSSMQNSCYIGFDSGDFTEVGIDALRKWCPVLIDQLNSSPIINGESLVHSIESGLALCTSKPFNERTTKKALKKLFQHWGTERSSYQQPRTRALLHESMTELLQDDIDTRNSWGLGHSRHRFMVYCLLARDTRSANLAETMITFFQDRVSEILKNEKHRFLMEWYYGMVELRSLIPGQTICEVVRAAASMSDTSRQGWQGWNKQDPLVEWILFQLGLSKQHDALPDLSSRGRTHWPNQLKRIGGSRASSLPSTTSRSGQQVGFSSWNQPTGALSPVWSNFVDKVNQLQWHQEEMNLKLDSIDRKLDCLLEN